ncbi:MAG: hypothetical protein SPH70_08540 [Candidatus Cryptobacteroides sp.]|nr:hypothetical protein [Bacteroidales bacterium]MDY6159108.1 hypothetical protein [Candidatus Cryptobacteroides sp.]
MNNIIQRLTISAVCVMAVCCTKVQQTELSSPLVTYQLIQNTQTKGASPYDENETFFSWAWMLEDGQPWTSNKSAAQLYIDKATIGHSSDGWSDINKVNYWPKSGYNLTFFAASPSDELGSAVSCSPEQGITISNWDVNEHLGTDVMVADIVESKTAADNQGWAAGVPTIFRHALSKISGFTFNLHKDYAHGHSSGSYANGDVVFILKSIVIKNMPQKGTYSNTMPSESNIGVWNKAADGIYSYTWYSNASGTTIPYSESTSLPIQANGLSPYSELYLLPQLYPAKGGPSLEIKYTKRTYTGNNQYDYSEVTASVSFYDLFASTGHRLVINRNLTFNIVFNIDSNLITWAPDQQDWGSGDFKIDF